MPDYPVRILPKAEKEIEALDYKIQDRIFDKIESLVKNPLPSQATKLKNTNSYRLRVGDYRIIYEIYNGIVYILKVGHRRDVYR